MSFYAEDAPAPVTLRTGEFLLRPLRSADVDLDYDAVMASKDILHLRSGDGWPRAGFTLAENLADLERHEADFQARRGFTYTVLNPHQTQCLGCVYIYPLRLIMQWRGVPEEAIERVGDEDAEVSFWVRQSRVADDLDKRLLAALLPWLRTAFAFSRLYLRVFAAERRQVEIFEEAGLRRVAAYPAGGDQLLLYA